MPKSGRADDSLDPVDDADDADAGPNKPEKLSCFSAVVNVVGYRTAIILDSFLIWLPYNNATELSLKNRHTFPGEENPRWATFKTVAWLCDRLVKRGLELKEIQVLYVVNQAVKAGWLLQDRGRDGAWYAPSDKLVKKLPRSIQRRLGLEKEPQPATLTRQRTALTRTRNVKTANGPPAHLTVTVV